MTNKQHAKSGDNSPINQANGDMNNYYGATINEIRELASDVFKANFYDLGKDIERLINSRAEDIVNRYLEKLQKEAPEKISSAKDPDLRYVIYEAQKSYVRSGDEELLSHLVDMLVERTKYDSDEFVKISYNEALSIIPKLSNRQIQIITIMFIVRDLTFKQDSFANLEDHYTFFLKPFLIEEGVHELNDLNFNHINYTGCSSFTNKQQSLEEVLRYNFINKYDKNQMRKFINKNEGLKHFGMLWEVSKYKHYELTSVGIAIALSNIKRKLGYDIDVKIFLDS